MTSGSATTAAASSHGAVANGEVNGASSNGQTAPPSTASGGTAQQQPQPQTQPQAQTQPQQPPQQQQQQQQPQQQQQQSSSVSQQTHTSTGGGGHLTYVSPSLYIGDLHPDVTEAMLYEVFNSVGPVTSIRVCRDSVTRRSLCYAYVNYQTMQDAERSLDTLNYTPIKGQPCRIMWSQRDPTLRKTGNGNVFVKNLDRSIDNKALYDTFSLFGNILSCKVGVDENNRSKGYGFVHYESEASARTAIEKVNGMLIGGKPVYVGPFKTRSERDNLTENFYTNVYIKNLPKIWSAEEALLAVVQPFGEVTSLVVRQDPKGRHFAFCNFAEHKQAKACVEGLNGRRVGQKGFKEAEALCKKAEGEQDAETTDGTATAPDTDPEEALLFAGPHQSKAQRLAALRLQYEQFQQEKGDKFPGMNLYIKNLDDSITDEKLRELFEAFGPTSSVKIMRDERGVSRGFAFVCFVNPEDATKAVSEMHLKHLKGKPLYVGLAEKREQRLQRLQQRFRLPPMRGGNSSSSGPVSAVAHHPSVPPNLSAVNAPPPHPHPMAAYAGHPHAAAAAAAAASLGLGGFAPRPLVGYAHPPHPHQHHQHHQHHPQVPVLPWRQQQQQQAFSQQQTLSLRQGLAAAQTPLQMYGAQQSPAALQQLPHVATPQQHPGRAPPNPGRRANANSASSGKQLVHKQQGGGGAAAGGGGSGASFKFTPQMRNPRLEQPHHAQQQPSVHAGVVQAQNAQQQQPSLENPNSPPPPHLLLNPEAPLTAAALAAAAPSMQKQMLGERLFPLIARHQPELAGKITGMMLEMDNSELLILLESDAQLKSKVDEALTVLHNAS